MGAVPDPKLESYGDDATLVAACLAGDRAAERALFRTHRTRVHSTLWRVLGGGRELDDLIQETFLEVFRSLKGFRGEAKLSTWIDRIAVRVAWRWIAAKKATPPPLELVDDVAAGGPSGESRAHAREGVRRLYEALAALPPMARVAFCLVELDGRSIKEAAALLGATTIATKVRVFRARRELIRRAAEDPVLAELVVAGGAR